MYLPKVQLHLCFTQTLHTVCICLLSCVVASIALSYCSHNYIRQCLAHLSHPYPRKKLTDPNPTWHEHWYLGFRLKSIARHTDRLKRISHIVLPHVSSRLWQIMLPHVSHLKSHGRACVWDHLSLKQPRACFATNATLVASLTRIQLHRFILILKLFMDCIIRVHLTIILKSCVT